MQRKWTGMSESGNSKNSREKRRHKFQHRGTVHAQIFLYEWRIEVSLSLTRFKRNDIDCDINSQIFHSKIYWDERYLPERLFQHFHFLVQWLGFLKACIANLDPVVLLHKLRSFEALASKAFELKMFVLVSSSHIAVQLRQFGIQHLIWTF